MDRFLPILIRPKFSRIVPATLKLIVSPAAATWMASRSEQSTSLQLPSFSSISVLTVSVAARASFGVAVLKIIRIRRMRFKNTLGLVRLSDGGHNEVPS